jgi:hypothetical protein
VAVPDQPDVAKDGERARRELIEETSDLLAQLRPVVDKAVAAEHVTTQPVPELLNRIEPGGVCRQPHRLQARQLAQRGRDVGMVVDRPVVLQWSCTT